MRGIQDAVAGAYSARMALVKVEERLGREGERSPCRQTWVGPPSR